MSFQYIQFGTGFSVVQPSPQSLNFGEHAENRGENVTIIKKTVTGYTSYGQPEFIETSYSVKGFIQGKTGEQMLPTGTYKENSIHVFLKQWAPVQETLHELEIEGNRYHVTGISRNMAYLDVKGERMNQ